MQKVALITGASKGIGREIAILLASKGIDIIIHYNSSYDNALEVNEIAKKYGVKTLLVKADLNNEEEINEMVNICFNTFGKIDYLVNNAAIALDTIYEDKTKENFIKTINVNLIGPFILTRLVADKMYENKFGRIVNISSTNGLDTYYSESLDYDASKAGLISLTHNLSKHYAPYININAVCPGWVNTEMNKNLDSKFIEKECEKVYLKRFAEPKEIAYLVSFLLSDDASYINNSIIRIDGGSDHE